jgi:MFS family permease
MNRLLARVGFRRLLIGQGVSALGDWMGTFALMALVFQESRSATAVGGILALRLLPAAVGGPLVARAASRWDRRRTMVAMDMARAGMIALVPLVGGLWWVYLWAFLIEVGSLVFLPARDASIPDLVDDDELPLANGLVLGSSYGTIPLGAALFALIAALPLSDVLDRPLALAFWLDALSFVVSAYMIHRISELGPRRATGDRDASSLPRVRFRDAFAIPLVRAVLPATIAVALGLGALFSLGIDFVRTDLRASDAQFGVLIALFGVGAALGLLAIWRAPDMGRLRATRFGVAFLGIVVAAFSLAPTIGLAFVGAVLFGAGVAWTLASGMGTLQSDLDGQQRILAFAVFHIVIRSGLAAAAIAAGAAGELVGGVRWPVVGTLEPARLVLFWSGVLVLVSSLRVSVSRTRGTVDDKPAEVSA